MPSTSKKQHNFMAAVANNPSFAKKVGVPQSVGKDFTTADKGRKFSKGGSTMATRKNNGITTAKMGTVRTAAPSRDGVASKGKTKGTMVSMAGDKVLGTKVAAGNGMKSGGMTKKMNYGGKAC
jgi:hypothetical protein